MEPEEVPVRSDLCLTGGLLDQEGWSCDVTRALVVKQLADSVGWPIRFGKERDKTALKDRGASDPFPVTVQLAPGAVKEECFLFTPSPTSAGWPGG
jgi:hypothetical protein